MNDSRALRRLRGLNFIKRLRWYFATAILLSGCVTTDANTTSNLEDRTRIVVVSALGNALNVQVTGTTVFHNWRRAEAIENWNVDERVEAIALSLLHTSRFTAVKRRSPPATELSSRILGFGWKGQPDIKENWKALESIARQQTAEKILLIGTERVPDQFYGTNQFVDGFGIYRHFFINTGRAIEYVVIKAWLLDASSGEVLASKRSVAQTPHSLGVGLNGNIPTSTAKLKQVKANLELLFAEAMISSFREIDLL